MFGEFRVSNPHKFIRVLYARWSIFHLVNPLSVHDCFSKNAAGQKGMNPTQRYSKNPTQMPLHCFDKPQRQAVWKRHDFPGNKCISVFFVSSSHKNPTQKPLLLTSHKGNCCISSLQKNPTQKLLLSVSKAQRSGYKDGLVTGGWRS